MKRTGRWAMLSFAALFAAAAACVDPVGAPPWLVTGERIVAVLVEPPEVRPGEAATLRVLVATPSGPGGAPDGSWAFCVTPKPLTENNSAPAACMQGAEGAVSPIGGAGTVVAAPLPAQACALFGPDAPPDGSRPRDPDATGGYYQPVRFAGSAGVALGQVRLRCNLASAPPQAAEAYRAQYVPNRNPVIQNVTLDGGAVDAKAVPGGAAVALTATWLSGDAETYLTFDVAAQALATRREAMTVDWFVTAGSLAAATSGRAADDPATEVATTWTAPPAGTTAYLWAVLRDSRGGAGTFFQELRTVP